MQRRLLTARSRRRSGFTLIETMFAIGIFTVIASTLVWMTIDTTRMGDKVGDESTLQSQGRTELDMFTEDAHASTQVMTTYTNGSTTYNSDTGDTIVLAAPSYNSSGIIAGSTDYIIYQVQGSNLYRIVYPATGSSRAAVNRLLASNVSSVLFTYVIDQQFSGDGTTTTFTLNSAVAGSGPGLVDTVSENGINQLPVLLETTSTNSPLLMIQFLAAPTSSQQGSLYIPTAPTTGTWIDAVYSVDPTVALNQTYITGVVMNLTLNSTNPGLGGSADSTTVLSGQTNLHNHPPAPVTQ